MRSSRSVVVAAVCAAGLALTTPACELVTDPNAEVTVLVRLAPELDPDLANTPESTEIASIVFEVIDDVTDNVLVSDDVNVTPGSEILFAEFETIVTGATPGSYRGTVVLVGEDEEVQWSGEFGPIEVTSAIEVVDVLVPVGRGDLQNLAVTSLQIGGPDEVEVGEDISLNAVLGGFPSGTVFWGTDDPDVVSVVAGEVTGLVEGTATITATSGMFVDSYIVEVIEAAPGIVTWVNPSGGLWSVGANWSTGSVPGVEDDVLIDLAGTYTVTIDTDVTVPSLVVGGGSGIQTLAHPSNTLTLTGASGIGEDGVYSLSGGTLTGGGMLTVDGLMSWSAGAITGAGTTRIGSTGTLTISGTTMALGGPRVLENQGGAVWSSGTLASTNGAVVSNTAAGTFDVTGDVFMSTSGLISRIDNAGVFISSAPGTATLAPRFNNTGTLTVQSGTLVLGNDGTSTGDFGIAAGATLWFGGGGHVLSAGSDLGGAGNVVLNTNPITVSGSFDVGGRVTLMAGTANFSATVADTSFVEDLRLTGGTLGGSGVLAVRDTLRWEGTVQTASGTTVVLPTGTLRIEPTFDHDLSGTRLLHHRGTGRWSGGSIRGGGTSIFRNSGTLLIDSGVAQFIDLPAAPGGVFENPGTLIGNVQNGDFTATIAVPFTSSGTVDIQAGILQFLDVFTLGASGVLQGSGTLDIADGSPTFLGTIRPGASPGELTILGDLDLDGDANVEIEIDGPGAGTGHDLLTINGFASLDGTLDVSVGSVPIPGALFPILTFNSVEGEFTTDFPLFEDISLSLLSTEGMSPDTLYVLASLIPEANAFDGSWTGTYSFGAMGARLLNDGNLLSGQVRDADACVYQVSGSIEGAQFALPEWTPVISPAPACSTASISLTGSIGADGMTLTGSGNTNGFDWEFTWTRDPVWEGDVTSDWQTAENWSSGLVPDASTNVFIPAGASTQPSLSLGAGVASLFVEPTALVDLSGQTLTVSGDLQAGATIVGGLVVMDGEQFGNNGSAFDGVVDDLTITGAVFLTGDAAAQGDVVVTSFGRLVLNGHGLAISGNFASDQNGVLVMENADDFISGTNFDFAGASTAGLLEAGTIVVTGNFTQSGDAEAFQAGGTNTVVLAGAGAQTVSLSDSGIGIGQPFSHFANLSIAGVGPVILETNVFGESDLIVDSAVTITGGGGVLLAFGGLNVDGLVMDGVRLEWHGTPTFPSFGTFTQFRNVTFQGFNCEDNFVVVHPGGPSPFLFEDVTFTDCVDGNYYLFATDSDSEDGNVLTINLLNPDPFFAELGQEFNVAGDAVINWPIAAPPGFDALWLGTVSNDWENGANWSIGEVPNAFSNVFIPAFAGEFPVLSAAAFTGALTVEAGTFIDLNGFDLTVSGDLDAGLGIFEGTVILNGSNVLVQGTMSSLVVDGGDIALSGPTTVAENVTVRGSSKLILATWPLVFGGQFSTVEDGVVAMLDPSDVLSGPDYDFAGGNTLGWLSFGTILVTGDFIQSGGDPNAFHASGSNNVILIGEGPQNLSLVNSGIGSGVPASHFANLQFENTGVVTLGSDVFGHTNLTSLPGSTATIAGAGYRLAFGGLNVDGMILDGVRLEWNGTPGFPSEGTFVQFKNVTFQNLLVTDRHLTVVHPGLGGPFTIENINFNSAIAGGYYVSATDSAPTDGTPLTIEVVNPTTVTGSNYFEVSGGAVVNWPF